MKVIAEKIDFCENDCKTKHMIKSNKLEKSAIFKYRWTRVLKGNLFQSFGSNVRDNDLEKEVDARAQKDNKCYFGLIMN